MALRSPTLDEVRLLGFLIDKVEGFAIPQDWSARLMVADMNDEGMGSLRLFPDGLEAVDRSFWKQVSECQFADEDGIKVIASLNLDQLGNLYELDIWKTNFNKLIRIPTDISELRRVKK